MFNKTLQLNYFPAAWKIGELVFFHKKGRDPSEAGSYRPITLLPIFGKILEKMILRRVNYSLLQSSNFDSQHGFMEGRSTETAIHQVFRTIEELKQETKYIFLVSLDFKNAFDCLPWQPTI